MAQVYFDPALGGDGSTVSDDSNPTTGLANGGHRLRFVPSLSQTVATAGFVKSSAQTVLNDKNTTEGFKNTTQGYMNTALGARDVAVTKANEASSSALSASDSAAQAASTVPLAVIKLNPLTIDESYQFPAGYNGVTTGPVQILDGNVITIVDGTRWSIV